MLEGRVATQKDTARLEKWANWNLMKLKKKCMQGLGQNNPIQKYKMGGDCPGGSDSEKRLRS